MDKNQDFNRQDETGAGRTFNRGQEADNTEKTGNERNDISSIDQQEGAMHHGETGGSGHFSTGSNSSSSNEEA